jgi:Glycolipid transfer protein (GLTP)
VDLLKAELGDSAYSALIKSETGRGRNSGSVAMLWMKRTLQFVVGLVNHLLTDPVISLSEASRKSYSATLKKCHPFITRNVFDAGLRFVPSRKVFYENIAGADDAAKAEAGLAEFVAASTPLMNSLIFSYKQNKLETLVY